jgi:hypothetical protein
MSSGVAAVRAEHFADPFDPLCDSPRHDGGERPRTKYIVVITNVNELVRPGESYPTNDLFTTKCDECFAMMTADYPIPLADDGGTHDATPTS